ncbi:MAG: hypothetical protein PHF00_05230 [Elusimicrobia bacterium]|nr:hypothetical protein [Elusimicrobiota bacterium]
MGSAQGRKRAPAPVWGPGIVEIRVVTSRHYGIRVDRQLVGKLSKVSALHHGVPTSDLFCVELPGTDLGEDSALRRFHEIVAEAGLGRHFGLKRRARR